MSDINIEAVVRKPGKNVVRKLKESGYIPAILYGKGIENIPLAVENKKIREVLQHHGRNALINVIVNGSTHQAIIKDEQRDEIAGKVIHVDFQKVSMNEKIESVIPLKIQGTGIIESKGLIVQHQLWELHIESLPNLIPEEFTIDISGFNVGDSLRVKDINVPQGVDILDEPEEVILTVVIPKNADIPETTAEETTEEPNEAEEKKE